MNSIDSKIPRRTECGDHIHDCPQLAEMLDDLREENARLRAEVARLEGLIVRCFGGHYEGEANAQLEAEARRIRVEELEGTPRCCADTIPPGCRSCRCADAAEARLAKVVEALSEYVSEDAAFAEDHLLCGGDCDWSARHKRARAALAAAKGE